MNIITTKRVYTDKLPLFVGDIHGMYRSLLDLLTTTLDFNLNNGKLVSPTYHLFSVGDLIDRGPDSVSVVDLGLDAVLGNHDWKALRKLNGNDVKIADSDNGIMDILNLSPSDQQRIYQYYVNTPFQLLINNQYLVAHGAIFNDDIDKPYRKATHSNIYGCPAKEKNPDGTPIRNTDWIDRYQLPYHFIYGHTPLLDVSKVNNTINIDTGAAFGNKLTAYCPTSDQLFQLPTQRPSTNVSTSTTLQQS